LKGGAGRVIPLVVTCVVYRSTFNEAFYETSYTSGVMVIEQGGGMAIPGTNEIAIPPERLFIETETYTN